MEGIHYSIHKRERKKLIKNPRKPMCSTCEQCNHKNLCLNRRNKETMDRCSKCRNCRNAEVCDKFKIYEEYEGNLLKLGKNANTGKNIRQSFGGKSKDEVFEKLEKQYIKNQEEGIKETVYQPNEKSIIAIAEELEEKKYKNSDTKAPGYIRNMQSIKACSAYNFTLKPIQNVTKTEIERFLESERVKGNSTLDKEYRIIKKAFEEAYRRKYIKENIFLDCDFIKKPKSYKEDKDVIAFTRKEEYFLVKYMKEHYSQYNNMLLLALFTGMRIGEVLALNINDINFDEGFGTITVSKTMTKDKNGKVIVGRTPKTKNGKRVLDLISTSREVIDNAIKEMNSNKNNMLFVRKDGKFYSNSQINSAFKRICKNAGLKVITVKHKKNSKTKGIHFVNEKTSSVNVHMLRHTFSTRCIEAGVPMEVLQKILGHANIQTTINIYGDIFDYYQRHHINNYSEYMAKVNEKYNKEFSNINDENAGIPSKNDIEQLNKNSIEKGLEIGL